MNRRETLDAAADAVLRDRAATHGGVEDTFGTIAAMWNAYLCKGRSDMHVVTPADVAAMMAMLKIARLRTNPGHMDSWVDVAGYAACGAELVG